MASMASPNVEQHAVKPSFAKVAASSYIPQNAKDTVSNMNSPAKNTHTQPTLQTSSPGTVTETSRVTSQTEGGKNILQKPCNPEIRTEHWAANNGIQNQAQPAESHAENVSRSRIPTKQNVTDDNSTQLSSSDGSAKPPSLDGKSIASGTTFALDEKESLRPDDSASLRAVEEEDGVSPPGSVATGSRIGSDVGGSRAFRDQLNEIAIMGPVPHRGVPPSRFQQTSIPVGNGLYPAGQAIDAVRNLSGPVVNGSSAVPPGAPQPLPDEKLLEALESARDRVWVLKLEQDFIDFVKDPNQNELNLPNCNAFYRMLAHRLADYFLLGHMVDESLTAVRISKTPFCRIPPPLSGFSNPSGAVNTPPLEVPTRKIMRRGDDSRIASGTSTTANSEGPSKAASEAGGNVSDGGPASANDVKVKATLTREEREAKYREARQRIFGDAETSESPNGETPTDEKDVSRSSSASGKKKNKKPRNYNDDGFEARSQFNAYYAPSYGATTYTPDNPSLMYMPFPGMMGPASYPAMPSNMAPPLSYGNGYSQVLPQDGQQQFSWAPPQTFQTGNPVIPYNMTMPVNYDQLSADFQRGMQSFQSAPNMTPQMSKTNIGPMSNPSVNTFMDPTRPQSQPLNQAPWPQPAQQQSYQPVPPQFNQNSNPPLGAASSMFPTPYPYGQLPATPFTNGRPNNQHPIPGSYNGNFQRAQFNPQTQAFVPGSRQTSFGMPAQPQMTPPNMGTWNAAAYQKTPQSQMPRPSPPINQPTGFSSPRVGHNSPLLGKNNIPTQPSQNTIPQAMIPPPAPSSTQSASSSLPAQSSIAKWGTPAHLPPKPPPPVSMQPAKFSLPGHNLPAAARLPTNVNANGMFNQGRTISGSSINGRPQ